MQLKSQKSDLYKISILARGKTASQDARKM